MVQTAKESKTENVDTVTAHPDANLIIYETPEPNKIPISPPVMLIIMASTKN